MLIEHVTKRDELDVHFPPDDDIWIRIDELKTAGVL
jgi:hypothetical protein